jgi:uncharacterized OB-fold protein
VTRSTEAFWTGGARGELLIHRCQACGYLVHPPAGFCPVCEGRDVLPEPVSGRATVATFTVNHQKWEPDLEVPYVMALVELDEQPGAGAVRAARGDLGAAVRTDPGVT